MQGGSTTTALAASLSWLGLVFVGLVHVAGGTAPRPVQLAGLLVATPVALAAAVQAVAAIWRGPIIVAFSRPDSVPCSPAEASFVRDGAQLRGLMGGAGHLYPRRLVLPALAWLGAAGVGAAGLSPRLSVVHPWAVAVALVAAFLTILFPARAYFYRDTTGGGAIVSPPSAAYRLKRRAARAVADACGECHGARMPAPTPTPGVGLSVSAVSPEDPSA